MTTAKNEEIRLVSHGFKVRCRICERHTHAKWHELARESLNPVALIEWLSALPDSQIKQATIGYVLAITGIDYAEMERELSAERQR